MTNKKLKQANIGMNMLVTAVVKKNHELLCKIFVALNDSHKHSANAIEQLIDTYHENVIPGYHELADGDAQNVYVRRALSMRNIEFSDIENWVRPQAKEMTPQLIEVLAENVGILFVHINQSWGYGKKRLSELLERAGTIDGNTAVDEAEKRFGLRLTDKDHLQDFSKISRRPHYSKAECEQFRRDMDGLEAYQKWRDENVQERT